MNSKDSSTVGDSGGGSPYEILRNRDFLLYLGGRLAASLGQLMFTTAVGWELYERTNSAFMLGLVGLTLVFPMFLLTLPAGHIADNHNRKHIIVISTLILAFANVGMTLISALQAPVGWVYLCLLVMGSSQTFLRAATASFLPQLVERKNFSRAVTWNAGMFQISAIVGPPAAGLLIAYAHHRAAPVYALNAIGATICCILMGMVRRHHVVAVKERMSFKALVTGFSFVFTNRIILGIITLDMFAVLLGGATAMTPIYAKDILHVGPRGLGLLQAALPLGAFLCGLVLAHRPSMQKAGRALLWGVTGFGLATIGFGFATWFWLSFLFLFAAGASDNISVVVRHTLVQMLTPDEKRGRVSAVNNLFIGTSNELGEFESGTVAQWLGPVFAVVSGGIGTILVVIAVALIWPEIRKYGRLDDSDSHALQP